MNLFSFSLVYAICSPRPLPHCSLLMALYKINDAHLLRSDYFNPNQHGVASVDYLHMLSAVSAEIIHPNLCSQANKGNIVIIGTLPRH